MNILYVNHTGQVSGGEKSLLEILRGVSTQAKVRVASPAGPLAEALEPLGVEHLVIPGTDGSLKLHPRHTPAALRRILQAAWAVRGLAREHEIDIVHANSIRAGLIVTLAQRLGGPPTVVHLRDRLPSSRVSRVTLRRIARADELVANSHYTAASLDEAGARHSANVLANPVDVERFSPSRVDRSAVREELGLGTDFVATVLGQITPWKGQEEAIRAVAVVRERHPAVRLLLVGSAKFVSSATRYDNRTYLHGLHDLVSELGLGDYVEFLGERDDVPEILAASDALLMPSWEEPFGRSMVEGMAMGVPVLATSVGGPAEIITHGRDGMLLAPRAPEHWTDALCYLIECPERRHELGEAGRVHAQRFSVAAHAEELMGIYGTVRERSADRRVAAIAALPTGGGAG
jgi:glycosyltransferase involved in cell wall biosynthesis